MQSDYERVGAALAYLEERAGEQPDLAAVAAQVHLSPQHFQRLFKRWVGISPKRFLQLVTIREAKAALARSRSLLDTTYEVGLSSPGRLHDLFVQLDAVTPGEFKAKGRGLTIRTGVHETPFGHALISVTERGLCGLAFDDDAGCELGHSDLRAAWPEATIVDDASETLAFAERIFGASDARRSAPLPLYVRGTNFQVKVWQALLQVPSGSLCTYGDLAERIGQPTAARAVGGAIGSNPVSWLIPCHRVVTSMGNFGNYRWGPARKKVMIGWELAQHETRGLSVPT